MKKFNLSEDSELFNTPMLQYLSMKKAFLEMFLDSKAWGELGSKKQVIAISRRLGTLLTNSHSSQMIF